MFHLVHGIGAKYQIGNNASYLLKANKFYIKKDIYFSRLESVLLVIMQRELNFEDLKIQKRNTPTNRA